MNPRQIKFDISLRSQQITQLSGFSQNRPTGNTAFLKRFSRFFLEIFLKKVFQSLINNLREYQKPLKLQMNYVPIKREVSLVVFLEIILLPIESRKLVAEKETVEGNYSLNFLFKSAKNTLIQAQKEITVTKTKILEHIKKM